MTSLAGCSGEDFASVLRSLGYRMEKRPKPAEPAPAVGRRAGGDARGAGRRRAGGEAASPALTDATENATPARCRLQRRKSSPSARRSMPARTRERRPIGRDGGRADRAGERRRRSRSRPMPPRRRSASEALPQVAEQAESPRQATSRGGEPGRLRPRSRLTRLHRAPSRRRQSRVDRGLAAGPPSRRAPRPRKPRRDQRAAPAPAAATRGRRRRRRTPLATAATVPADGERKQRPAAAHRPAPTSAERGGRPRASRAVGDRNGRADAARSRQPRPDRRPSEARAPIAARERPRRNARSAAATVRRAATVPIATRTLRAKYIKGRGESRDRRDREPDPNSPFAKLAALKEQLEANTKEPR